MLEIGCIFFDYCLFKIQLATYEALKRITCCRRVEFYVMKKKYNNFFKKEVVMKSLHYCMSFIAFISFIAFSIQAESLSQEEAEEIGKEIYIYGYPLITMDLTRQILTNTATADEMKAPMNQFANSRHYPDSSFKAITAPNADTLYSTAWLDLSKEPYVLHVPNEDNRYYLMPILSAWTNVFADPGTRTTGTLAADFVITGPNWEGQLPQGLTELKSPTNLVWILGRTYCTGTLEDYKVVHAIQNQYSLKPLSYYGKDYTPPTGKVNPLLDKKTPIRDQVNHMEASAFFQKLAFLIFKENPPAEEDAPIVKKMALIGLIPGQLFDFQKLETAISQGLRKAPKKALEMILDYEKRAGTVKNGWKISLKTGGIRYRLLAKSPNYLCRLGGKSSSGCNISLY